MYTEYLDDVEESGFQGVMLLGKKTFGIQLLISLVFTLISILLTLAFLGNDFLEFIQELQAVKGGKDIEELMPLIGEMASSFVVIIPISFVLLSFQYALSLRINDDYIKYQDFNLRRSLNAAFKKDFIKVLLCTLILLGIAFVLGILTFLLTRIFVSMQSIGLMIVFMFVLLFIMAMLFIRTMAAYAYIVHDNQRPVKALQSSFGTITMVRALILLVIGIGFVIGIGLAQVMFGIVLDTMISNSILSKQIQQGAVSALIYPLMIAGISSLYFRYNRPASTSEEEQVGEHLISE